jgi:hypothetical protein
LFSRCYEFQAARGCGFEAFYRSLLTAYCSRFHSMILSGCPAIGSPEGHAVDGIRGVAEKYAYYACGRAADMDVHDGSRRPAHHDPRDGRAERKNRTLAQAVCGRSLRRARRAQVGQRVTAISISHLGHDQKRCTGRVRFAPIRCNGGNERMPRAFYPGRDLIQLLKEFSQLGGSLWRLSRWCTSWYTSCNYFHNN